MDDVLDLTILFPPLIERLLAALKQLVNLFLINGYAFGGSASIFAEGADPTISKGTKFLISLNAPATRKSSATAFLSKACQQLSNPAKSMGRENSPVGGCEGFKQLCSNRCSRAHQASRLCCCVLYQVRWNNREYFNYYFMKRNERFNRYFVRGNEPFYLCLNFLAALR